MNEEFVWFFSAIIFFLGIYAILAFVCWDHTNICKSVGFEYGEIGSCYNLKESCDVFLDTNQNCRTDMVDVQYITDWEALRAKGEMKK